MRQSTFVKLGLLCFGLILVTFVVRGTTRLIIGDGPSLVLSVPFGLGALALLLALTILAVLNVAGIRPFETDLEE